MFPEPQGHRQLQPSSSLRQRLASPPISKGPLLSPRGVPSPVQGGAVGSVDHNRCVCESVYTSALLLCKALHPRNRRYNFLIARKGTHSNPGACKAEVCLLVHDGHLACHITALWWPRLLLIPRWALRAAIQPAVWPQVAQLLWTWRRL